MQNVKLTDRFVGHKIARQRIAGHAMVQKRQTFAAAEWVE